jgi:hypothetical protein
MIRQVNRGYRGKTKNLGFKSEYLSAKRMNMKNTPGSGNQAHSKGDFYDDVFLVEHKSTVKDKLYLKGKWLNKVLKEGIRSNKLPLLMMVFSDKKGNPLEFGSYIIAPMRSIVLLFPHIDWEKHRSYDLGACRLNKSIHYSYFKKLQENSKRDNLPFSCYFHLSEGFNPGSNTKFFKRAYIILSEEYFKESMNSRYGELEDGGSC